MKYVSKPLYCFFKVIRFSLNILTKIRVQNLYQTSASKYRPNCRQYVIQHQQQQHKNTKNFWVGIIKSQSHISQVSPTTVSQWVRYKGRQWSDAGWSKKQIKFVYILCIQVGTDCTLILQLVLPSILSNHPPLKRKYAFNTSLPSFGSENVCRI